MGIPKKAFFVLLFFLALFAMGTAVFSEEDSTVYDHTKDDSADSVTSEVVFEKDFFTDFRIGREQRRDAEKELYESILRDPSRSEEAKSEAEASLTKLYRISSLEDAVEDILIGRNYEDALFVMEENISLLMIRKKEITETEKDALLRFISVYAGIPMESISVFTVE